MQQDVVLFIDDAEALLSMRTSNVNSSADNSMNALRTQFLVCLEQYKGLVIFATNRADIYDTALETRLWTIHFDLPNEEQRIEIWRKHLPLEFPTTATVEDICTNMPLPLIKNIYPKLHLMKPNNHRNTGVIRLDGFEIEISEFKGNTIVEDLYNRDFTINAMALDSSGNLIDPCNGLQSLQDKKISLIDSEIACISLMVQTSSKNFLHSSTVCKFKIT